MGGNHASGAPIEACDLPARDITLSRGFLVGEAEVTVPQFCAFLNQRTQWLAAVAALDDGTSNACTMVVRTTGGDPVAWIPVVGAVITNANDTWQASAPARTNHPMVDVTWYGAALYCNFLSETDGYVPMYDTNDWSCVWGLCGVTNSGYHLPSEAQWEYAARGWQRAEAYPWGRFMDYSNCNVYKASATLAYDDSSTWPCTRAVGSYPANSVGMRDVIGNVAEWCNDWYDPRYYTNANFTDPTGPIPPEALRDAACKVVRGGGWGYSSLRRPSLSARGHWHPRTGARDIGFRVVREWSGNAAAAPTLPLNVAVATNSLYNLTLAWMPPLSGNQAGYVVYADGVVTARLASAATEWRIPGVVPGHGYLFELYATNVYGVSVAAETTVLAYSSEPTVPRNLRAIDNAPTHVTLAWQPPASGNQEGYRIDRNGVWQTNLAASATNWTDNTVQAESNYVYAIVATNTLGASPVADVTVTVSNHLCELTVSPAEIAFDRLATGGSFGVGNAGPGNLYWTNTVEFVNGAGWLSVSPVSGVAASTVSVSVDRASFEPNTYSGRVVVTSNGGSATVAVSVVAQPILAVSPTTLDFGYETQDLPVAVSNRGCTGLSWGCSICPPDDDWLSVAPASGNGEAALTVSVDRSAVELGLLTGEVVFASSYDAVTTTVTMGKAQLHWWVDCLAVPGGDGKTAAAPLRRIQDAIDSAAGGVGATVHIHGGTGRRYTNTAYTVDKSELALVPWDGKPVLAVDGSGDRIDERVVDVAANGVTLCGLRFEIDSDTVGAGDSVVEFTGGVVGENNITIEGCEFIMTDGFGGAWNQGSPLDMGHELATNKVVKDCLFRDWDRGDGYRVEMIRAAGEYCEIVGNTFSNFSRGMSGDMRYSRISSNRFLNTVNTHEDYAIIRASYHGLRDCEISYNIMWNDNGKRSTFLRKTRDGFSNARIFNNTIVNARSFVDCVYYAEDSTLWDDAVVVNNLMLAGSQTNVLGDAEGSGTNMIRTGTRISHNLWYGGATVLSDVVAGGVLISNQHVDCVLVNTNSPGNAGFLRPNARATPRILNGHGAPYPGFIGAVPPLSGGTHGTLFIFCATGPPRSVFGHHMWAGIRGGRKRIEDYEYD